MTSRHVWGALAAGLCVAAAVAVAALLSGELEDFHWRVIGTSLGFGVYAAIAGTGDAMRRRPNAGPAAGVGLATVVLAVLAYLLLLGAMWIDDDADGLWRTWGVTTCLALCGSHASLVLGARRATDRDALRALLAISIAAASFVTLAGTAAILEAFDDIDDDFVRLVAVVGVVMLLTTALQPILRRLAPSTPAPASAPRAASEPITRDRLAAEIAASADRLERLDAPPEVREEAAALRALAGRARG